jgi:hypothetical protein
MGKKFSNSFKATPDKEKWNEICPPNEYRVYTADEARGFGIIPTGMTNANSVIVGASGSTSETIMYFANYCRVDNNDIDQEPYFELFESGATQSSIYGIFHHADFEGRTEELDQNQLDRIAASGSTADIQFTAKPVNKSGTLDELRKEGKIEGFNHTWNQGMKKKK